MTPIDFVTKNQERLNYLHDRWQDEREYENFDTYRDAIKTLLPEGWTLTRAISRPFEFEAKTPTQKVRVRVTSTQLRHWTTAPRTIA